MNKLNYFVTLILFMSCASDDNTVSQDNINNSIKYFCFLEFNQYGIPSLGNEIAKPDIPDHPYYYLVIYTKNMPEYVYIIKQEKEKADALKPFKAIYKWTGKGFHTGYENSKGIIEFSTDMANSIPGIEPLNLPLVIISAVPGYVVGTSIFIASGVTGFIIGLGKSVPEAYNEIRHIGKTSGLVLGKYFFEYDGKNRIIKYIQYSPAPDNIQLSETTFYYYGKADTPYKSINYSFVEKKNRVIYSQTK